MVLETTDIRSGSREQIAHAAEKIGRSKARLKVFEEIVKGKKRIKTASEISSRTGLPKKRVEEEAAVLYKNKIVKKTKVNNEIAYEKDDFYQQNKATILRLAGNKSAIENYPTNWNPRIKMANRESVVLNLQVSKSAIAIKQLSIDDIDSFQKVRGVALAQNIKNEPILEASFKSGLQKILGENGEFKDWGGEKDDVFSNRLILNGTRMNTAFGLKGRGTSGKLTPRKMGKQGDQVQRLFSDIADIFLIQYWGQIDKSIIEQMQAWATMKSVLWNKRIYYGVIDGQDTLRIIEAYKECF